MVYAGAAVGLGQGRAQKAQGPHLGHDLAVEAFLGVGRDHPGQEFVAGVGPGGLPDHPLILGKPRGEIQGVFPAEGLGFGAGVEGHVGLLQSCRTLYATDRRAGVAGFCDSAAPGDEGPVPETL